MKIIFTLFLFINAKIFAQNNCPGKLYGFYRNEKVLLCGGDLMIDSMNYIYLSSGCEQHAGFLFDKCHISNDTIYIDKFDFLLNEPFFKITATRIKTGMQQVSFKSIDGKPMYYRFEHPVSPYFATARTFKNKRRKLILANSSVTFKNGTIKMMELHLLSRIFGVPITFWVRPGYSYKVIINLPGALLANYCVHGASNFPEAYLLIKNNEVVFPADNFRIPITCRQ
jgi:hypothetical protein